MSPDSTPGQLALNIRLRDASSFENFLPGRNREPMERVQQSLPRLTKNSPDTRPSLYLWGETGSGKTHLLEAACRAGQQTGLAPIYFSLRDTLGHGPELLEDLDQAPLVCMDDVDALAGDLAWEQALLSLYEGMHAQGGLLIVAARHSPAQLGLKLPDLATRFAAGLVYPLQRLTDEEKISALRLRAEQRGMQMGEDVALYLLTRYPRDPHSLFALLDKLDDATLAAQRRLTIPFLRSLE